MTIEPENEETPSDRQSEGIVAFFEDAGDAHLVVDAGTWIFGQVRDAPQFLADQHLADRQYREDVVAYYRLADTCEGSAETLSPVRCRACLAG
ncbi:hypothetical protein [Streptomyces sp. NPDC001774]